MNTPVAIPAAAAARHSKRPPPALMLAGVMAAMMGLTAVGTDLLKPDHFLADRLPPLKLEAVIPASFGAWQQVDTLEGVVNPQQRELLDKLYTGLLSRTYVDTQTGYRIMLSIAYGKDQRDSLQVHKPEICYPAQGFEMLSKTDGELTTPFGAIPVRRIETAFKGQRNEPVTYWTTLGEHAVKPAGLHKKLLELDYARRDLIADGLLFRMSSIDADTPKAYDQQARFARDLLAALTPEQRLRLSGLR